MAITLLKVTINIALVKAAKLLYFYKMIKAYMNIYTKLYFLSEASYNNFRFLKQSKSPHLQRFTRTYLRQIYFIKVTRVILIEL